MTAPDGPGPPGIPPPIRLWEHRGIACALVSTDHSINGYVQIPPDHPWRCYDDAFELPVDVHGGITYGPIPAHEGSSDFEPRPARTWELMGGWIGFDTMHSGDFVMAPIEDIERIAKAGGQIMMSHWTEDEVAAEVERLADQAADAYEDFRQGAGKHDDDREST